MVRGFLIVAVCTGLLGRGNAASFQEIWEKNGEEKVGGHEAGYGVVARHRDHDDGELGFDKLDVNGQDIGSESFTSVSGMGNVLRSITPSDDDIDGLAKDLEGKLYKRGDHGYKENFKLWNMALERSPRAVVVAGTEQDVKRVVAFAAKYRGMPLTIFGTGHSYQGYSGNNDGLVLSMRKFKKVELIEKDMIVKVGAGCTFDDILSVTLPKGYAVPAGDCIEVGIGGYGTGGGYGFAARKVGLMIDNLKSVQIVTSESDILTASQDQNSDLMWALQGGGAASFGVLTELTLKVHRIQDDQAVFGSICYEWDRLEDVLYYQWKNLRAFPNDLFIGVDSLTSDPLVCYTIAYLSNNATKALHFVKTDLMDLLPPNASKTDFQQISWLRFQQSAPKIENVKLGTRCGFLDESTKITRATFHSIADAFRGFAKAHPNASMLELGMWGGVIPKVKKHDTPFYWRESPGLVCFHTLTPASVSADTFNQALISMGKHYQNIETLLRGTYYNYLNAPIPGIHSKLDEKQSFWGEQNLARLQHIKRKYDHGNLFQCPKCVEPWKKQY